MPKASVLSAACATALVVTVHKKPACESCHEVHLVTALSFCYCIAGNPPRSTYQVFIVNSNFIANNATNTQPEPLFGIYDTGQCAGMHISSCGCVSVLNNTFTNKTGIGVCVRDVNGKCEALDSPESDRQFFPTFNRSTAAGNDNIK